MERRETCYFCTSTYQLFSIITLAINRNEVADFYIDPQFKDAALYAERINKYGIFNKISIIKSEEIYERFFKHRDGFLNKIDIAKSYLKVDKIAEMILDEDVEYENIFISSRAYMPRIVILSYYKHKIEPNIYYFDDGLGSYYGDMCNVPRKSDEIVRRILFGSKAISTDHEKFLFSPNFYKALNPTMKNRVYPIESIWDTDGLVNIINFVFNSENITSINEKVIILEEPYNLFNKDNIKKLSDIIDLTNNIIGKDNVIIKKHPRSEAIERSQNKYYPDYGIPFEIICMNHNLTDSILISYCSTSVITPKLFFDQEPYVIMLYNIIKSINGKQEGIDKICNAVKNLYSNPDKFYIPESISEFGKFLETLR